jgi:hypothetical protein
VDIAASTSRTSRVTHVVQVETIEGIPGIGNADRWLSANVRKSACGKDVHPTRTTLKPSNDVCLKCRKALGWPLVVTWESHGHTFTTDFRNR